MYYITIEVEVEGVSKWKSRIKFGLNVYVEMSSENCNPALQIWCGNPLCWVEGSGGELCQAFALLYQQYSWHLESFGRHEHKQLQEGLDTQLFSSIRPFSTDCSYMVFHSFLSVSLQVCNDLLEWQKVMFVAACILFIGNCLWATKDCSMHRRFPTDNYESLWSDKSKFKCHLLILALFWSPAYTRGLIFSSP